MTRYLTQKKKKQVIVYGVQNAFSAQLKAAATQYIEYPYPAELTRRYYDMILQNFDYISGKNINPTFLKTITRYPKTPSGQPSRKCWTKDTSTRKKSP